MNDRGRRWPRCEINTLLVAGLVLALASVWHAWRQAARGEAARARELDAVRGELQAERAAGREARREIADLEEKLRRLEAERQADREVAAALVARLDREALRDPGDSGDSPAAPRYGLDQIKEALVRSSMDFNAVIGEMLPPEAVRALLQQRQGDPEAWAAAASLVQDPAAREALLREGDARHPRSPAVLAALVETLLREGSADPSTAGLIRELAETDPTSSLPDLFEACYLGRSGDLEGAEQAVARANTKDRFADYRVGLLMSRNDFLLDAGVGAEAALGLAAFGLDFSHLGMARELANALSGEIDGCLARGQPERAREMAAQIVDLGESLSASGRFIIYDLVGIALQQAGLDAEGRASELMGHAGEGGEIDRRHEALNERAETIKTMVHLMDRALGSMSEAEISAYVSNAILDGEFVALQNLPVVRDALQNLQPVSDPR